LLDAFLDVAPDVAHGGAMILQHLVQMLHDLLAAVFGERRNRNAHYLAVYFNGGAPRTSITLLFFYIFFWNRICRIRNGYCNGPCRIVGPRNF